MIVWSSQSIIVHKLDSNVVRTTENHENNLLHIIIIIHSRLNPILAPRGATRAYWPYCVNVEAVATAVRAKRGRTAKVDCTMKLEFEDSVLQEAVLIKGAIGPSRGQSGYSSN